MITIWRAVYGRKYLWDLKNRYIGSTGFLAGNLHLELDLYFFRVKTQSRSFPDSPPQAGENDNLMS